MVVRIIALRHQPGVLDLAVVLLLEADREGLDALRGDLAHQCDDGTGVNPSAKERAERHVADQSHAHGLSQQFAHPPHSGFLIICAARREIELPVLVELQPAVLERERMARRQLLDARKGRARGRYVAVGKVLANRDWIEFPLDPWHEQERLDLGAEDQAPSVESVVDGLLAESIACEHETAPQPVPEGDGKHAMEAVDEVEPILLVSMDDGLRVAVGRELVARGLQLAAKLLVVVDLAVEDDHHGAIFVGDRLLATLHVDDAQPAHAQAGVVAEPMAVVIRATVPDDVRHIAQQHACFLGAQTAIHKAGYSAHGSTSFGCSSVASSRCAGRGPRPVDTCFLVRLARMCQSAPTWWSPDAMAWLASSRSRSCSHRYHAQKRSMPSSIETRGR